MSKKDGTLFAIALFGYKKSDVNDFIRRSDAVHANQISLLQSEKERLLERAQNAEARVCELEKIIARSENCTKATSAELETASVKTSAKGKQDGKGVSTHNKSDASRKRTGFPGTVKKR